MKKQEDKRIYARHNLLFGLRKNLANKNGASGITLIALVITIIVLLILAAVSIATLTGDNGILTQATKAEEKTKTETEKEQIEMEVIGSYDETGEININTLNNNLMNNLENVYFRGKILSDTNKIEDLPVVVTYNGVEVKIGNGSGKFSNIITANNYGDKVKYTGNGVDDWKIFYNNGNIFLISSDIIPNNKIANEKITKGGNYRAYLEIPNISTTEGASSVSDDIAKKFLWNYKFQYQDSLKANSRALNQILFDTENWSRFVDTNYAEVAIGGSTIEMWINSWNEKYPNDLLYCQIYDEIGYKISADNEKFDKDISIENNGDNLYFPRAAYFADGDVNCYGYFLASNMWDIYENGIATVDFNGFIHGSNYWGEYYAFRPVVCLKSDVKAHKGTDGVWILEE